MPDDSDIYTITIGQCLVHEDSIVRSYARCLESEVANSVNEFRDNPKEGIIGILLFSPKKTVKELAEQIRRRLKTLNSEEKVTEQKPENT